MFESTVLPFWFVGPFAAVTQLFVVAHLVAMRNRRGSIPPSRYRVRTVNGGIMLVAVPLLAAAFSVVPTDRAKLFVMVWFACTGLLVLIVILALVDAVNNVRLMLAERQRLREEFRTLVSGPLKAGQNGHDGGRG